MRIISKHRDFYDSALAHGADMGLVYERRTRTLDVAPDDLGAALDLRRAPRRLGHLARTSDGLRETGSFTPALLLFCGQAHPLMVHGRHGRPVEGRGCSFLWTAEEVGAAVAATGNLSRWESLLLEGSHAPLSRAAVAAWFAARAPADRAAEAHARHGTPVILYRGVEGRDGWQAVLDPVLADLAFYRVKDAFAAFQDIAMYLGGVLRSPARPGAEVSDRVRAEKHGLDAWSFRRPPQGAGRK